MRKVKIQGKTYPVPDSWEDCTVDHLIKVMRIMGENTNELAKAIQVMQALTTIPNRVLQACNLDEVNMLAEALAFRLTLPLTDSDVVQNGGKITLDGVTYTSPTQIGRMQFQQFVDFEVSIEDCHGRQWEMIPYALAIYMSDDHKRQYDSNDMLARAELFRKLPVLQANSLAAFFLLNAQLSSTISQACTVKMASLQIDLAQAMPRPTTRIGSGKTPGTARSTGWLRRALLRWLMWSARRRFASLLSYTRAAKGQRRWSLTRNRTPSINRPTKTTTA
jgi:hypothetical protein